MKKSDKTSRSYRKSIVNSIAKKLFRDSSRGLESLEPRQMLSGVALTNVAASEFIADGENSFTVEAVSSEFAGGGEKVYAGFAFYTEAGEQVEGFRISKITDEEGNDVTGQLIDRNATIQKLISYNVAELDLNQQYTMQVEWTGNGDAPKFSVAAYMMGDLSSFANYQYGYATAAMNGDALNNSLSAFVSQEEVAYAMASRFSGVSTNWNGTIGSFNGYTISRNAAPLKSFVLSTDRKVDAVDVERIEQNAKLGYVDFQISFDSEAPIAYIAGNTGVGSFESADKTFEIYANNSNPTLEMLIQDEKQLSSVVLKAADADKGDLMTLETLPAGVTKMADIASDTADYNNIARFNLDLAMLFGSEGGLTDGSSYTFSLTVTDAMKNSATYTYNITYQSDNVYVVSPAGSLAKIGGAAILNSNVTDGTQKIVVDPAFTTESAPVNGDTTKQRIALYTYNPETGEQNGTYVTSDFVTFTYNSETGKWTHPELTLESFFKVNDADGAITETTLASALDANEDEKVDDGTYPMTFALFDQFGHNAQNIGHGETSTGAGDATNVVTLVIDTVAPAFTFTLDDATGTSFSLLDDAQSDVVVTLDAADATAVSLKLTKGGTEISSANLAAGTTVATAMTIDNVYGKSDFVLTATDAAGNAVTKSFTIYSNNAPTATAITAEVNEAQTPAYTAANGAALDFAAAVADVNTADSTLTVSVNAPANGKLCVENADGSLSALVPADGKISFTADKTIYYVPNQYWFGTESLTYTVTDNFKTVFTNQTNATSTEAAVSITVNAVDSSLISLTYPALTPVNEDSSAADQTVATFSFPTNEARDWSASAVWSNAVVNQLNAGGGTDAASLFTTAPTFAVVADGEPSNGIQNYKVVMSGWALGANLWGTEDFTLTIDGAKAAETAAIADLSVTATSAQTFTVSSVNDAPAVDTTDPLKTHNVSLSTLAKGDVTLAITDDMYSDIDDDANLTISKITIGETEIAQGSSAVIAINGIDVTFALNGKNIVISQNASKALDKGTITFAITVADNAGADATSSETQLSTVKFSAYASDDTVNIKEDAEQTGFNVLKNDKESSENWDGKTFTISQVNGYAVAVNVEITLTVDGKTAGVLKVLDLATAAEGENNFAFTPAADWNGTAAFVYTIVNSADSNETATATVTINVEAVNDYPTTFTWNSDYADVDSADLSKATTTFGEDKGEIDGENQPFNFSIGTYTDIDTALADLESIVKGNATLVQAGKISADQATDDGNLFTDWSLSVVAVDGAANQYDLQMTVTLKENAWGTATLTFTPTDAQQAGSQGIAPVEHTLTINVTPVNDAPVTDDTEITIEEDADYTEIVLSSVSDVESPKENLFLQVTAPTNGKLYLRAGEGTEASPYVYTEMTYTEGVSAWITGAQRVFYKPNANYFGTDTFQYQVKDTLSDSGVETGEAAVSNIATFTVNITAVNDAPVFTPATDFTKAADGENAGKYVINTNLNEDAASTTINLGKVSDVDTALESITISTQTVTSAGTKTSAAATADMSLFDGTPSFAINTDGDLIMTYKLAADVSGYADITIQVNDGQTEHNLSETFQFKLVVDPVNDAPVATDAAWGISIGALENAATGITYDLAQNASDVDGDTLSYSNVKIGETTLTETAQNITVGEGENAVVVSASISGSVVTLAYISGNIDKLDKQELALAFTVSDGALTDDGTGTIKFSAYTQDDEAQYTQIAEAATQTIFVLANDTANWGDKVFKVTAVSALSDTSAGTISIVDDSKIDYVQAAGYRGTFTFTYTISEVDADGALVTGGETAEGAVTVLVQALNAAPTAAQVDASIGESQNGTDKIQLAFAAAVADAETADDNLTITIAENAVVNGTLVDSEGIALTAADGKYTFAAATEVYFKPNLYYHGTVTIPYTVTDRVDAADFAGLTLADGETVETAASNAVVVVAAATSAPIIEWNGDFTGLTCKEDKADFEQTFPITVGTIKLPSNEAATLGLAAAFSGSVSGAENLFTTFDGIFTLSEAVKVTTDGIEYNVWTISMNDFSLVENAWCADGKFTLTLSRTIDEIKSDLTPTKEIAFIVTSVNDAPTTTGVKQTGVVTGDTGTWSKTTAELKALVLAASSDVDNTLTAGMITIPTADLPDGMTYDSGTDTYSLTTTTLSDTFTLTYTINDGESENNTVSGDIVISFNQVPVLNNYVGNKTVNTSTSQQAGSWKLFSLADVTDPEGKTVTKDNIVVTGATWDGDDLYLAYDFAQGSYSSKSVTVTITDPDDATITQSYDFTVYAIADVVIDAQNAITSKNNKVFDFGSHLTVATTDSFTDLDLNALFGNTAGTYTVTSIKSTTTGDALATETETDLKMIPVVSSIDSVTGKLHLEVKPYRAEQYRYLTLTVSDGDVSLDLNIGFQQAVTVDLQYLETTTKSSVTSVNSAEWFSDTVNSVDGITPSTTLNSTAGRYMEFWSRDYTRSTVNGPGPLATIAIRITFPAPVYDISKYSSIDDETGEPVYLPGYDATKEFKVFEFDEGIQSWNDDRTELEITTGLKKLSSIYNAVYSYMGSIYYAYEDASAPITANPTIEFMSVMRSEGANTAEIVNKEINLTDQVSIQWVEGQVPAIYGTESAEQTVVEGTGVYMQLTTDAPVAQTAETLPQSESWINEWQDHYVNLYANTQDATIIDGRLSFALNYDPAYFTATDFVAGDALMGGKIEYVDGKAYITGLVDSLDSADGFVLLGSVKFESLESNGVAADTVGSVDMGLSLSAIVLNDANGDQIAVNTQSVVDTRLWAVVYDANDSGAIDMADFISFATYFNTNTIVSNDALAWALDFDKSGSVNMNDFIKFAENFNASRANGQKINFADGFVQEYIGVKLDGEGDTNLRALVEKAVDEWETKLDTELDVNIQLKVVDYEGAQLGSSYIVDLSEEGTPATGVITLDADAAGYRWSVSDNEIYMNGSGEDMYDLYTVILHEIGHMLGYTDQYSAFNEVTKDNSAIANGHNVADSSDLMYATIERGERKNVSSDNAQIIKDAYEYAKDNGAELTYEGSSDLAAAINAGDAVSTVVATGMVSQSAWTNTVTAKVTEEIVRIENEVRQELFLDEAQNIENAVEETNPELAVGLNSNDFVLNLAGLVTEEEDDLFADLSWLDEQPAKKQDADNQSQYPFGEI